MNKMTMLGVAVAMVVSSTVFAEDSATTLGEGESILVSQDGTLHKSDSKISDAQHEVALARGATEVPRGMAFYKHEGKLYSVSCRGQTIGGWEQGYPGTDNFC